MSNNRFIKQRSFALHTDRVIVAAAVGNPAADDGIHLINAYRETAK
jgi:hypothetical protein